MKHCLFITVFVYELIGLKTCFFHTLIFSLKDEYEKRQSGSVSLCKSACCTSLESFHSLKNEHNANESQMCCNPFGSTVILSFEWNPQHYLHFVVVSEPIVMLVQ